jgi:hypothetical protein
MECGASKVSVDAYEVSRGKMGLSVQDDGIGMVGPGRYCSPRHAGAGRGRGRGRGVNRGASALP